MLSNAFKKFSDLKRTEIKFDPIVIGLPRVVTKVNDQGVVIKQVEFTTDYNVSDQFEVNDFALSNLLNAGVKLTPISIEQAGFQAADHAIKVVETIKYNEKNL